MLAEDEVEVPYMVSWQVWINQQHNVENEFYNLTER